MRTMQRLVPRVRAGILVLLCAAGAAAQGSVLVVAPAAGPGVDYTKVSEAVVAAADGDTVYVHAGSYAGVVTLGAKSLTLVAQPGAVVTLDNTVSIAGLGGQQFVSLAGFTISRGLKLDADAGAVWIEGCAVNGFPAYSGPFPFNAIAGHGIEATNCAQVTVVRSVVKGGDAISVQSAYGGHALKSTASSVWLFDSALSGGTASANMFFNQVPGHGVEMHGGSIYAEGSSLVGYVPLWLNSGLPDAWLFGTTLTSSTGFTPVIFGTGQVTQLAGTERDFSVGSPVHELESTSTSLTGVAGDTAFLFVGLAPGSFLKPQFHGPLLLNPVLELLSLGVLPGDGQLEFSAVVPSLPVGLPTLSVLLQSAFVAAQGAAFLSDPARLVVLGAQY